MERRDCYVVPKSVLTSFEEHVLATAGHLGAADGLDGFLKGDPVRQKELPAQWGMERLVCTRGWESLLLWDPGSCARSRGRKPAPALSIRRTQGDPCSTWTVALLPEGKGTVCLKSSLCLYGPKLAR